MKFVYNHVGADALVRPPRLIIGVTGPSGSGKSYVLDCWVRRGVVPIYADAVYHELLETDASLQAAILARFPSARRAEGVAPYAAIDRRALAGIVFSDPLSLRDLEAITHPAVIAAVQKQLSTVNRQITAAVEAIALIESGMNEICAATVAVTADQALRLRRLVMRDNRSEQELKDRMAAGKPASWYTGQTDYVLDGNSDNLEEDAIKLLEKILCK